MTEPTEHNKCRKRPKKATKKTAINSIVAYHQYVELDKTQKQIADEHKCSDRAVGRALERYRKEFLSNIPKLDYYKKNRADILANKSMMLASSLTREKIDNTSVKDIGLTMHKLNEIERLERGQSTENIGVLSKFMDASRDNPLRHQDNGTVKP